MRIVSSNEQKVSGQERHAIFQELTENKGVWYDVYLFSNKHYSIEVFVNSKKYRLIITNDYHFSARSELVDFIYCVGVYRAANVFRFKTQYSDETVNEAFLKTIRGWVRHKFSYRKVSKYVKTSTYAHIYREKSLLDMLT